MPYSSSRSARVPFMNRWTRHRHWDEEERRRWQNPEAILAKVGLKPGLTFMDLGCGDGFFTIPAARLVGKTGKVYGLDSNAEAISHLSERASTEGITNIDLKVGRAEDTLLCAKCADVIFFGMVLHDFQEPARVLANARKMVKPAGRLVNVDWKKEPMPFGPPLDIRFTPEQAKELIEAAGFSVEKIEQAGIYDYLIIARPS